MPATILPVKDNHEICTLKKGNPIIGIARYNHDPEKFRQIKILLYGLSERDQKIKTAMDTRAKTCTGKLESICT
jgi:hypothetical protein